MPKSSLLRIGLVQGSAGKDPRKNLASALQGIEQAGKKGAQVVALQELFLTRYFPQKENARYFDYAETVPGPTTEILSRTAKKLGLVIVASLFEKRTAGIYHNTGVVIDADGSLIGKYRKMHIPDDPGYYEKFYFTPGDLGFQSFSTRRGKIGILVCWDQWFPEAARLTALSGAQIIFYPTAIGWLDKEPKNILEAQRSSWELIQRSHALANGVFVVSVNRVGREGKIRFWGNSFIADPFGQVVARAGLEEKVLVADCDLSLIARTRQSWPFLRDRRIDAYEGLTARFLDGREAIKRQ